MTRQMIIRIDDATKKRFAMLARAEGKSISALVRELIDDYVSTHDREAHFSALWDRIGDSLRAKGKGASDVEAAIEAVRRQP